MRRYTEEDVLAALANIRNRKSIRTAVNDWGVSYSTIRDRRKGSTNHVLAAESQQRLSTAQKKHLTSWILAQEALGLLLTYGQIREFACRLLIIKKNQKKLEKQ